jgi:hypothetical protein
MNLTSGSALHITVIDRLKHILSVHVTTSNEQVSQVSQFHSGGSGCKCVGLFVQSICVAENLEEKNK